MTLQIETDPDYALFCEERLADPHPFYHRLRAAAPVYWSEQLGLWLVTRYDDVQAGVRDDRFSTSRAGMYHRPLTPEALASAAPLLRHLGHWLLLVDPPDHTGLRKLVNLAFTPAMVRALHERIEQIASRLLDALPRRVPVDMVPAFCYELPVTVISTMLGMPAADRETFGRAVEQIASFSARGGPELAGYVEQATAGLADAMVILDRLIAQRRQSPQDDLISALIAAEADGVTLSAEELYAFCVFLFVAGHDTTSAMLASGLLAFMQHPGEREKIRAAPDDRITAAIEELMRYESAVPRAVRRAKHDLEIGGQRIGQGDTVVFLLGAANRDPAQFPDPDRFDIDRRPNRHLAFGYGPHFCLGAPLARLELQIAFKAFLRRDFNFRLAADGLQWRHGMGIRGLESLPVVIE